MNRSGRDSPIDLYFIGSKFERVLLKKFSEFRSYGQRDICFEICWIDENGIGIEGEDSDPCGVEAGTNNRKNLVMIFIEQGRSVKSLRKAQIQGFFACNLEVSLFWSTLTYNKHKMVSRFDTKAACYVLGTWCPRVLRNFMRLMLKVQCFKIFLTKDHDVQLGDFRFHSKKKDYICWLKKLADNCIGLQSVDDLHISAYELLSFLEKLVRDDDLPLGPSFEVERIALLGFQGENPSSVGRMVCTWVVFHGQS